MADLTITAASVLSNSSLAAYPPRTKTVTAGATVTAGQPVYLDTAASNAAKLATKGTAAASLVEGIALHAALSGQPLIIQYSGALSLGSILTATAAYVVGSSAGAIAPDADLASTWYATYLGWAYSTSVLIVSIQSTQVAKA